MQVPGDDPEQPLRGQHEPGVSEAQRGAAVAGIKWTRVGGRRWLRAWRPGEGSGLLH